MPRRKISLTFTYADAKDWQRNPNTLETERVQLWSSSGGFVGLIPLEQAKRMVANKTHFVICSQAIGKYTEPAE